MAANCDDVLMQCQCGTIFASREAAQEHVCWKGEESDVRTMELDENSATIFQCSECENFFNDMDKFKKHGCQKPKAAEFEETQAKGIELNVTWNRGATLLLLDMYQGFSKAVNDGKMLKKSMWGKISSELKKNGYPFSTEQVNGKWKSLMRAYKNVKDNNRKSGSGRKTFEFESEMDNLFEKDPSITPLVVLSSASKSSLPVLSKQEEQFSNDFKNNPTVEKLPVQSTVMSKMTEFDEKLPGPSTSAGKHHASSGNVSQVDITDTDDEDGLALPEPPPKKRKVSRSKSSELVDIFKTYLEDQKVKEKEEKERQEAMHKERQDTLHKLISVLAQSSNNNESPRHHSSTFQKQSRDPRSDWD